MISDLLIINPITYPQWDELITQTKNYSFFNTSAWAQVLNESYGYTPLYFTLIENDHLRVAIPIMEVKSLLTGKRGVSFPFTDYCDLIISKNIYFQNTFKSIIEHGKKNNWKYIEARGWEPFLTDISYSCYFYKHMLSLTQNEDEVFARFRNSTKRNIKKSKREGIEVKIDGSKESLKEFYMLNCITRKRHGLPPQPYFFFRKVHKYIIAKNNGFIVIATHKKKSIAAAIYFHSGQKAYFKYGASNKKYQHLRANNLIMWEAIKWYCQNGYKQLCFGKTDPQNRGLIQFKAGWGTKLQIISYCRYDLKKENFIKTFNTPKTHYNLFNKLPMPLLKLAGNLLYKHMG